MEDFLRFLLLGLGAGGIYALLALGIVLVYRGSGVVNFANGAFALIGAATFYDLREDIGVAGAVAAAVMLGAAAGFLVQVLIMRPMRTASPLARVVATLGVLVVIQEAAVRRYGQQVRFVDAFLPSEPVTVVGEISVSRDRIWILAITIALTAVLYVLYRFTRFGLATTGVAENERATAALGWSPSRVAAVNWAAGGALAGLAGALLIPITGLAPTTLTLTVVPALSAALLGRFASFPLTLLGGLTIGVLESEATLVQTKNPEILGFLSTYGLASAVPFLTIIAILVIRGRALPLRSHVADRLPKIGSADVSPVTVVTVVALVALSLYVFTDSWVAAVTTSGTFAFVALSLVVVTGYAGQLSLAQFALAGVGALFASRMADVWGLPFPLAFLLGIVCTIPIGLLVALPAVRARGVNLAVATLGLAVVISSAILSNADYTGGPIRGTVVPDPKIFGLNVQSTLHPTRYALVVLGLLTAAALMVRNVRRGVTGRRLIAVRDNERAAASLGVSVIGAKLYAFSIGAALAAAGGILLAFRSPHVSFDQFSVFRSIEAVLLTVIGGIGYISGAMIAGSNAVAGIGEAIISHVFAIEGWFLLIAALLLLVVVLLHPDGIAEKMIEVFHRCAGLVKGQMRRRAAPVSATAVPRATPVIARRVEPRRLEVEDLTVRFGGVTAVDHLSLEVAPGEVVGLIGPNGAGKTTVIDAVTGFLRNYAGRTLVDGRSIDELSPRRRAHAGLTRSFQSLELFEDLTVGDNLRTASEDRSVRAYFGDLIHPARPPLSHAAAASIAEFELGPVLEQYPTSLPYAQRRAVAIARAVATSPSVLLLDEPAAGLDAVSTRELAHLIRRLADEWGMAILLVEHDVAMVLSTCDRVVAIDFGRELASGTPGEIRHHRDVVASYLGDDVTADSRSSDGGAPGQRQPLIGHRASDRGTAP